MCGIDRNVALELLVVVLMFLGPGLAEWIARAVTG